MSAVLNVIVAAAFAAGFVVLGVLVVRSHLGGHTREALWVARIRSAHSWDEAMGRDVGGIAILQPPEIWTGFGSFSSRWPDVIGRVVMAADPNGVAIIRADSLPYRRRFLTRQDPHEFVCRENRLGVPVLEERFSGLRILGAETAAMASALYEMGWWVTGASPGAGAPGGT